jgi:hypothetical protein
MSPPGRPKGEYRRAQPEGTPVSKHLFYVFPASSILVLAALLYPREAAETNIVLSAPLNVFYLWFAFGLLFATLRRTNLWAKLGWTLLTSAPIIILLQRLPAPV